MVLSLCGIKPRVTRNRQQINNCGFGSEHKRVIATGSKDGLYSSALAQVEISLQNAKMVRSECQGFKWQNTDAEKVQLNTIKKNF